MSTFTIIFISAFIGFIIRPCVDALSLILENAWHKYETQKDKTEHVYPQEVDLPNRWEMGSEYIDNVLYLTIKFKQPLLTKRIKLLQEYISEYKIVGVVVRYELI